jgi:putative DNA primase/helicase
VGGVAGRQRRHRDGRRFGISGDESYAKLQQELPPDAFAQLLKVRTGSGGTHLYFRHPGGHVPCQANFRTGIDVKADGGYVVAPPSLDVTGVRYRFASNSGLLLPPLPQALCDLTSEAQVHAGAQEGCKSRIDVESLRVSNEIKALIRDGKPEGQRSEAIFTAIRAMIKAGHGDEEIIAVLVDPANRLSEKPREKGAAWLSGEITRAREKPDRHNSSQPPAGSGRVLISRRASEIQPEAIHWLWPQRIAQGKLCLIAGQPGLGKSQVTTDIAATVPRLEACGANLDRVHIIGAVHVMHSKRERPFYLKHDLETLAEKLTASPDANLVVIDPISAYLGGINSHNNAEVRSVLAPLAKLAAHHGVAVVCVTHLNKSSLSPDPLARVIDSTAFGAAVRTAFLIAKDKINPDRRLFLPLKSNVSRACSGLAFQIEPHILPSGIETSRVSWEGRPVTVTAEEALSPLTPDDDIDSAKETARPGWLANCRCMRIFLLPINS